MHFRFRNGIGSPRFRAAVLGLGLTALLLTTLAAPAPAREGNADELCDAVAFAKQKVYPCLVNISVIARQFVQGRESRGIGAGSGVLVSPGATS
jgi:hypothetical protein